MLQAAPSLVTHIGSSETVTTVAVDGAGGALIVVVNGAVLLNMTAPKLAAYVGLEVGPPFGTIASLTYFMGSSTQTASYAVFPVATSPVVYNPAVLFDPYLVASASVSHTSSRRTLLAGGSFVGLPLSWTCFQASLSRSGGGTGGKFTQLTLTVGSYAGTDTCASQQVSREGSPR